MENSNKPETRGRKPKSGKTVKFRPSNEVWAILENLENRTEFIEKAVLFYDKRI